jgi:tRNA G18 (ribose-2'-O)-methylase SpoU
VAASKIYLCGGSETPPNIKIKRASVGTDKWVPWQYDRTAKDAILKLKTQNPKIKIIAIEQNPKAVDYRLSTIDPSIGLRVNNRLPVAFIVGHETTGVSKETLKFCDEIVEIPMFGVNRSLNVMVSLAIVLYRAV